MSEEKGITEKDLEKVIAEEIKRFLHENRDEILRRALDRLKGQSEA